MKADEKEERVPYIDNRYYCKQCGQVGKCDPITSMCFDCGADDWEVVKGKEGEIGY